MRKSLYFVNKRLYTGVHNRITIKISVSISRRIRQIIANKWKHNRLQLAAAHRTLIRSHTRIIVEWNEFFLNFRIIQSRWEIYCASEFEQVNVSGFILKKKSIFAWPIITIHFDDSRLYCFTMCLSNHCENKSKFHFINAPICIVQH